MTHMQKLLYKYTIGERVRAPQEIVYASTGVTVPEGAIGRVGSVDARCTGLAFVRWPGVKAPQATSLDSIEPVIVRREALPAEA